MMRRWLLILLILLMSGAPVYAQDNRSVYGERWNVAVTQVDAAANRFHVTEQQDLTFTGTFRAGTRTLSLANLERYDNIRVSVNGLRLTSGCDEQPGHVCVSDQGDSLRVRYVFPTPATDETVRIKIEYDVFGAIRIYDGGDQIQWRAIPEDHEYPIRRSLITVQLPDEYAPRAGVDPATASAGTVEVEDGVVSVTITDGIAANTFVSVRVQFPHNPDAQMPAWQIAALEQETFRTEQLPIINVLALALAAVLGLGVPLTIVTLLLRQQQVRVIVPEYLTEPPDDLPPALAAALLDGRFLGARQVLATLFDLAHRGYLQMEQLADDHLFRQLKPAAGEMLRPFEHQILRSVFSSLDARTVSSLEHSFYTALGSITQSIRADLEGAGLVRPKGANRRGTVSFISLGLIMIGLGVIVYWRDRIAAQIGAVFGGLPASDFTGLVILIGVVMMVDGISAWLLLRRFTNRTRAGEEAFAKWSAFRRYLEKADVLQDQLGVSVANFSRYLPYTIAFGLDQPWISRLSREPNVSAPPWYIPFRPLPYSFDPSDNFDFDQPDSVSADGVTLPDVGASLDSLSQGLSASLASISTGLTDMLNSASAAMTSHPPSVIMNGGSSTSTWSSGSDSSWSSGGDSWSGGGDSGGGSSGGGDSGGGGSSFD